MTQQQLADLLFISDKAISKWERGISLPDITILEKISKIFNVSVAELIKGEKFTSANNISKYNEAIIDSIEFETNKNKIHKKRTIIVGIVINIIILLVLLIFFLNNYNNVIAYKFSGWSKNFSFYLGNVIYSKGYNNSIIISGFKLNEESDLNLNDIKDIKVSVLFDNQIWQSSWYYSPNDSERLSIKEWLGGIIFSATHLNKNCIKYLYDKKVYVNCDSFELSDKNKFPNNMQIKVDYCNYNTECFSEILEIEADVIAKNSLF